MLEFVNMEIIIRSRETVNNLKTYKTQMYTVCMRNFYLIPFIFQLKKETSIFCRQGFYRAYHAKNTNNLSVHLLPQLLSRLNTFLYIYYLSHSRDQFIDP